MSVNYQLFELGTLFNGWAGNSLEIYNELLFLILGGGDKIDFKNCPSTEEIRQFLQVYLKLYLGSEPSNEQLDKTVSVVPLFQAVSFYGVTKF